MRSIVWTNEAILAAASLAPDHRRRLLDLLDTLGDFPAMYPRRQRGRYAGLRYFVLERRWLIYYRENEAGAILVFAIVPARARSR